MVDIVPVTGILPLFSTQYSRLVEKAPAQQFRIVFPCGPTSDGMVQRHDSGAAIEERQEILFEHGIRLYETRRRGASETEARHVVEHERIETLHILDAHHARGGRLLYQRARNTIHLVEDRHEGIAQIGMTFRNHKNIQLFAITDGRHRDTSGGNDHGPTKAGP